MKWTKYAFLFLVLFYSNHVIGTESPPGRIVGWGEDSIGEATGVSSPEYGPGLVTISNRVVADAIAIAVGLSHSLALKRDGKVIGWGGNGSGKIDVPAGLSNVVSVAAGSSHSLALRRDGTVVAWGHNASGQATVPEGLSNLVAIAGGGTFSLALKRDGTVVYWGQAGGLPATKASENLTNVVAIAASDNPNARALALKADGTVVFLGFIGPNAQIGVPTGLSNVVAIAAGEFHNLALKKDGTVVGWGYGNWYGQATGTPTDNAAIDDAPVMIQGRPLTNAVAISARGDNSMALLQDGTVVQWGYNKQGRMNVPTALSNVVTIASGGDFCLAITTNTSALPFKK